MSSKNGKNKNERTNERTSMRWGLGLGLERKMLLPKHRNETKRVFFLPVNFHDQQRQTSNQLREIKFFVHLFINVVQAKKKAKIKNDVRI